MTELDDLEAKARAAIADCNFYRPSVKWNEEALSCDNIPGVAYEMRDTIAAFIAAANPAAVLELVQRLRAAEGEPVQEPTASRCHPSPPESARR
jgi:hypothetical protein